MAKIKVSEASGRVLNWLVAKCEGYTEFEFWHTGAVTTRKKNGLVVTHAYSYDWAQGGPILDLEKISCHPTYTSGTTESGAEVAVSNGWVCFHTPRLSWQKVRFRQAGATLLIAAMRCYITSKLREEVEVPDELLEE